MERADDAGPGLSRPEFSRIVSLNDLGKDEMRLDLHATNEECAALARRFGLAAIAGLRASGGLGRSGDDRVRLRVTLEAAVTQACVVTLDPIASRIEEEIDITFDPELGDAATLDIAFEAAVDREPLMGDSLDLGEIIAEELALSLDPYPRKPGIALEIGPGAAAGEPPRGGPFEALAALKRKE